MKLSVLKPGPSRPQSKFFAIADLALWGFTMCSSGFSLTKALFFGGTAGWWYCLQIPLFLFQFWMFKRALIGYFWFMSNRDE